MPRLHTGPEMVPGQNRDRISDTYNKTMIHLGIRVN